MAENINASSIENSIQKKYKKPIWHKFIGACKDYNLIESGDKIAVCISGGKDSFLLAKCMQALQKHSEKPFELVFLCMDPGYKPENRAIILQNAKLMQLDLHIFNTDIFASVENVQKNPCYLCARMRRGHLYKNAQSHGCNKIALGHHFNDVIETAVMSMLYSAQIKTMLPKLHSTNYKNMQLIRPLYMVNEKDIKAWVRYNSLQFLQCACRFTEKDENHEQKGARAATKKFISIMQAEHSSAELNIFRSLHNVNLNLLPSYIKDGELHSFLDDY